MVLKRMLVKRNSVLINNRASEQFCTNYIKANIGQIINIKDAKIKRSIINERNWLGHIHNNTYD